MSDVAIRVNGLGKQYCLGATRKSYGTLREKIREWASLSAWLQRGPKSADTSFWALRDLSFEVERGDIVGIIGRNGAGKSTLLKILSRITEPTEGQAELFGRVGSLLEVGTGFHPELTGRENIFLNGAILGMKRAEIIRKFDEIVAFAEVERFIDTVVKHYSSGMCMRLAFAVAAHLEPEILVLDEVLAVGDAEFQKKCLGKMGEVAHEGRTVLFVSHNMGAVQSLCERCIILEQGRLTGAGPTAEIVARYLVANVSGNAFDRRGAEDRPISIRSASLDVRDDAAGIWLEVATTVQCAAEGVVSVDLRIADAMGAPVGFAPVGSFNQDERIHLPAGRATVHSIHDVTALANGSYTVSIDIAKPSIEYHDRVEQCLSFEINAPVRPKSYRRMQQSWGYGSVEFPLAASRTEFVSDQNKQASFT